MSYITAIILGIVQGLTEFLPVSSSGHLVLFQNFLGTGNIEQNYFAFDILVHFGTLISVIAAFYKDVVELIKEFFSFCGDLFKGKARENAGKPYRRLIVMLIIGTLPAVLAVFVKDYIEAVYSSISVVGFSLLITAILLFLSDRVVVGRKDMGNATYKNSLFVGVFQLFAILPGISRSGSTISAGIFSGFSREFAVKFSFLLAIPAVLGANLLNIFDMDFSEITAPYLVGMIFAAVSGFFAIKLVRYIAKKNKFGYFALYCAVLGLAVLVYSFIV